jgi:hypothetical protein
MRIEKEHVEAKKEKLSGLVEPHLGDRFIHCQCSN